MNAARCPRCARTRAAGAHACSACGQVYDTCDAPTGTAPRGSVTPRSATPGTRVRGASSLASQARFVPGTLLANRYRIVEQVGQGGMGEVYRADDLLLSQPVALKFLPEDWQRDRQRLARFYEEVRLARQVSHSAVCRVHDVGEVEGLTFLSMEYVRGEDLSALLRRIGRLPPDKALDVARQLCAALAAAHGQNVLHRDLKPQNIMLDEHGNVRLADFGLAGLADTISGDELRSGTPAYMSPEQLAGREVSVRSDVYALGLVLYELFAGRRAFDGHGFVEWHAQHQHTAPEALRTHVPDIDPAVERVVLACLEKDPERRPASARAVAAALPGSDPLAAALAAGETPSPELVAAAGRDRGLSVRAMWACLLATLAGLLVATTLNHTLHILHSVPAGKVPEVLEDRARELARAFGYVEPPVDEASGFYVDEEYLGAWRRGEVHPPRLESGAPAAVQFWYRSSPRPLTALQSYGVVSLTQPPALVSGMISIRQDLRGRLLAFNALPPQVEDEHDRAATTAPLDWTPLFAEAGLDPAAFHGVSPRWLPASYCDTRAAWEGRYPGEQAVPVRVEAASYRNRPVAFNVIAPWTRAERMQPRRLTRSQRAAPVLACGLFVGLLAAGAWLARANLASGRGDQRGARRLAMVTAAGGILAWLLAAHHVFDLGDELMLAVRGSSAALFVPALVWIFYVALEPDLRRLWPRLVVSWARLLAGGFSDVLVGQDLLIGSASGTAFASLVLLCFLLPRSFGHPSVPWYSGGLDTLTSPWTGLANACAAGVINTIWALAMLLLLSLLRLALRREHLIVLAFVLLMTVPRVLAMQAPLWVSVPISLTIVLLTTGVLLRFGLLALVVSLFVTDLLLRAPLTLHVTGWAGGPTLLAWALIAALSLFGFRSAHRGSRRFGRA